MGSEKSRDTVECAIAIVWPEGFREPVCEMFRVDRRAMTWTSKHYSSGATFSDGGRLHDGETARSLAASGTRSGIHRFSHLTTVTFVVADLDPRSSSRRVPPTGRSGSSPGSPVPTCRRTSRFEAHRYGVDSE